MKSIPTKLNILVVDDDESDFVLIERLLQQIPEFSCHATHCPNVAMVDHALEQGNVDCVLLDYRLGADDGLTTLKEIRAAGHDVALVTCTGQGEETVAVEAMKRGAQDYLSKSRMSVDSLYRAISNAVQKVRLQREVAEKHEELEQFVQVASHDLKSPLSKISMFCELIREECGSNAELSECCRIVIQNTALMMRLIDSLLEYSRVGHNDRPTKWVDLNAVTDTAISNLEVQIADCQGQVTRDELPQLNGDEIALIQLMQNLIANAIKFRGDQPPHVEVLARETTEGWTVSVCDNGIGIAPEHQEKIFQTFQRLHGIGEYEGSGIGLATCLKIVEQHDGRIDVESQLGRGTKFHMRLPATRCTHAVDAMSATTS